MNSLLEKLKTQYKSGSMAIKLLIINVGFFVLAAVISILFKLFSFNINLSSIYGASPEWKILLTRPWTLVTYMFAHDLNGISHLLWNMVLFYFAGTFFVQKLGSKKLLSVYLVGGFVGFLAFFLGYNFLPAFANANRFPLIGASAAVIAVFVAGGTVYPNHPLKFTFIAKPIKLSYIVGGIVLLDLIRLQASIGVEGANAGGWISHLGGAIFGFYYGTKTKQGKNILYSFEKFLDKLFSLDFPRWFTTKNSKPKMKVKKGGKTSEKKAKSQPKQQKKDNEQINTILDKVKKSGYQSLSPKEKEIFFKK
jgi:membrane associated rhomboid family serine protease